MERRSPPSRRIRVVFSTLASSSLASVWKTASLAVAELNVGALFVVGALAAQIGSLAPWFILLAWAASILVRGLDIESWAVFIPGGTAGRVEVAFGQRPAQIAAAATLAERLLLAALGALLVGHYLAAFLVRSETTAGLVSLQDVATGLGVVALGVVWIRARFRRGLAPDASARGVWTGLGILAAIGAWAALTALFNHAGARALIVPPATGSMIELGLTSLVALGVALPLLGGGDALASAAHDSPPPRVRALQRIARLAAYTGLAVSVVPAFAYAVLISGPEGARAANAPLAELSRYLAGPPILRAVAALALVAAVVLLVIPVLDRGLSGAEQTLRRLSARHLLPVALTSLHPRFGTPSRTLDLTALAVVVIMILSGGYLPWLVHAYAFAVGALLVANVATLVRLRTRRPGNRVFTAPGNVRVSGRDTPAGPIVLGVLTAIVLLALVVTRDGGSIAAISLMSGLWILIAPKRTAAEQTEPDDAAELLAARDVAVGDVDARPGNILISVRNPHSLSHVAAALETGRDAVVMTARLLGVDVDPDVAEDRTLTPDERRLFARVAELAERRRQPIRLLVVPARNVVDALVTTALRLRSSEIHVGESTTLTGEAQARMLGEAWERTEHADDATLTLVIHHHTGRSDAYHIGAHPPSFTPSDLNLIHRV